MVMLFSFTIMGILVYRTYTASMPVPDRVTSPTGQVLFTKADITKGQELFQARGLMEYGSIMGHGAYLGPDFTADYLRRATDITAGLQKQSGIQDPTEQNVKDWRTNRYKDGTLTFSANQTTAYNRLLGYYENYFGAQAAKNGLLKTTSASRRRCGPHVVLCLDGMGLGSRPARSQLQLHQQLAGREARRQRTDRRPAAVVCAVPDRPYRWHGCALCDLRTVEPQDRLALRRSARDRLQTAR